MIKKFINFYSNLYRRSLSKGQRIVVKKLFKFFYYKYRFIKLKIFLNLSNKNVNLILGAALTNQKRWFSTQKRC